MSQVLNFCWKEWRAQRGLLVAYTLLVFTCLGLALYLAPRHSWFEEGFGVHALSWFVAAGVIGVVVFAAPGLVRSEFTSKDDQFVRRLPVALGPSFGGKLLFLVLVACALPLLGLLVGELFVGAVGGNWNGLFTWRWDGEVAVHIPDLTWVLLRGLLACMLVVPWVWAVGLCMPGGRLALLGTALLVLLVGVCVFAVLRSHPFLEAGVRWQPWLWTVPVSGLVAAAGSWRLGRRGGGPMRSARFGLVALLVMLLPGAAWLGQRVQHYRYPRLDHLNGMTAFGVSPDGRHVLAQVSEHPKWLPATIRLDLENGRAEHLASAGAMVMAETTWRAPPKSYAIQRYWLERRGQSAFVLDLQTGLRHQARTDENLRVRLSDALQSAVTEDLAATGVLASAGGVTVHFEGDELVYRTPEGVEERVEWPLPKSRSYYPAGHGIRTWLDGKSVIYDLVARRLLHPLDGQEGFVVHRHVIFRESRKAKWCVSSGGGEPVSCSGLEGAEVIGLLHDDALLACRETSKQQPIRSLFVFYPATGAVVDVPVPDDVPWQSVDSCAPMHQWASLLPRDPAGAVWLHCRGGSRRVFLRIDAESLVVSVARIAASYYSDRMVQLIAWAQLPQVVMQDGQQIVRVDVDTGERAVLFPRD